MTALELIAAVQAAGATLRADPPDLVISNPKLVPADLKAELRARKPELLRILQPATSPEALATLDHKRRKLEAAGASIAIFPNGVMRVCRTEAEVRQSREKGGAVYSPEDMYFRAQLTADERRLFDSFKTRFHASTRWKKIV